MVPYPFALITVLCGPSSVLCAASQSYCSLIKIDIFNLLIFVYLFLDKFFSKRGRDPVMIGVIPERTLVSLFSCDHGIIHEARVYSSFDSPFTERDS